MPRGIIKRQLEHLFISFSSEDPCTLILAALSIYTLFDSGVFIAATTFPLLAEIIFQGVLDKTAHLASIDLRA